DLLADYVAARLSDDQRRFVEGHLAGCESCRAAADDLKEIGTRVAAQGEAMFGAHPDTGTLRRLAAADGAGADPTVASHVAACASCGLEVEFWRRRIARRPAGPMTQARSRGRSWTAIGTTAAAAAVVGLLVGMQIERSGRPSVSTAPPGVGPSMPAREDAAAAGAAPILHVLPAMLRGAETTRQVWTLDPLETQIAAAVPLAFPSGIDDTENIRFELRPPGGAPVWSFAMPAGRIRRHLETAEMVNLPPIPTSELPAGDYEFVVQAADPAAAPIYRAVLRVDYRQPPADTKAPQ
ncbi:MAG TPA: zf-HC2 domain-containing protein, partial [Patescibacteria group bacterium]|nr:zf-HC2 domain-containing protein [Patescibacteria group bacterium]